MKNLKVLLSISLVSVLLFACSGGGLSNKCKELYNERISYSQSDADVLKSLIESEGKSMKLNFGTSFFHLDEKEQKTWDACQFGEEMNTNLTRANAISKDAEKLSDLNFEASMLTKSEEEKDEAMKKMHELITKILDTYTLEELDLKTFE